MKLSVLLSIAVALVSANAHKGWVPPKVEDAAVYARTLINRESLANINTIYQSGNDDEGLPASFVEYYADCGDGNPVILAIDMATSFKNINMGSPATLSVRVGDHAPHEDVDPSYPGSRPQSVAGSPRINLRGKFVEVSEEETPELEKCFLKRHKDAALWLPGNPIHSSHWVKFEVDDAYYLGGFGDTGYIGKISGDLYKNADISSLDAKKHHQKPEKFDHKDHHKPEKFDHKEYKEHKEFKTHSRHPLLQQAAEYTDKINNQIDLLKKALTESSEAVIPVEEHIKAVWSKSIKKRDNEEAPAQISLKELTQEQIVSMITELEDLKQQLSVYTTAMIEKISSFKQDDKPAHPKSHHKWELKDALERGDITEEEFKAAKAEIYKNKKHHKGPHSDDKHSTWAKGMKPHTFDSKKAGHPFDLREKFERGEISEEEFKAAKAEIYKNIKHGNFRPKHADFRPKHHRGPHAPKPEGFLSKISSFFHTDKAEKKEHFYHHRPAYASNLDDGNPFELRPRLGMSEQEFRVVQNMFQGKTGHPKFSHRTDAREAAHQFEDSKPAYPRSTHSWELREKLDRGEITVEEFRDAKADIYRAKKAQSGLEKPEHKFDLKEKLQNGEITLEEFKAKKAEFQAKKEKFYQDRPVDAAEKAGHPFELSEKLERGEITEEEFRAAKKAIYQAKESNTESKPESKSAHPKSNHKWELKEKLEKGEITEEEFKAAKAEIYRAKKAQSGLEKPEHKFDLKEKLQNGEITLEEFKAKKAEFQAKKEKFYQDRPSDAAEKAGHPFELREKLEKGEITEEEFRAAKKAIYQAKESNTESKPESKSAHPKSNHKWELKEKLEKGEITEDEFKAAKAEIYKNKKQHDNKPHDRFRAKELRQKGMHSELEQADFTPEEENVLSSVWNYFFNDAVIKQ